METATQWRKKMDSPQMRVQQYLIISFWLLPSVPTCIQSFSFSSGTIRICHLIICFTCSHFLLIKWASGGCSWAFCWSDHWKSCSNTVSALLRLAQRGSCMCCHKLTNLLVIFFVCLLLIVLSFYQYIHLRIISLSHLLVCIYVDKSFNNNQW